MEDKSIIKVLLVEDNPGDARLIREMLAEYRSISFNLVWVKQLSIAIERLLKGDIVDVILLDLLLPDSQGLETFVSLHKQIPEIPVPVVILTGLNDEESAIRALREGAQDYLIKGQIDSNLMVRSIRYALERKRLEDDIRYQAHHDPLTDLPNRLLFIDHLRREVAQAPRDKHLLAVMFLDLDNFKGINDSIGHEMGDQFLKTVAKQLTTLLREGDTVGRFGGDEFVLLLHRANQVEDVAKIVQRIIETIKTPWTMSGREFHITASLGIAIHPNDGEDAETLLRNADIAMYRAKEGGRNNYQFYTSAMSAKILERLELENSLRRALEHHEFVLHYQPRVNVNTAQIVGVEALIRWQHPDRGLISPAEFIPIAEESGLIVPIEEWVLHTACSQNKTWQKSGFPTICVSVNISSRHFQQQNLPEKIDSVLKETGLDGHWLDLEITEGTAMEDVEHTIKMLCKLKEMGIRIEIDDFGVGYSSLNYLKRLPIDALKIDRSFVKDINIDLTDLAIVITIINLAKNLKLKVIAEGVETKEQLVFLKEQGCDEIQGYLFSKPVPVAGLEKMLLQNIV